MDEQVTIERRTSTRDPIYGTETESWEVVADHVWANAQDILPSRSVETAANGMLTIASRTRLRIRVNPLIALEMRVTLHDKGNRVMTIKAGPAFMDDRRHVEFMLEGSSHG